jgi:hypothetical protein
VKNLQSRRTCCRGLGLRRSATDMSQWSQKHVGKGLFTYIQSASSIESSLGFPREAQILGVPKKNILRCILVNRQLLGFMTIHPFSTSGGFLAKQATWSCYTSSAIKKSGQTLKSQQGCQYLEFFCSISCYFTHCHGTFKCNNTTRSPSV